jgi:serine/threonine-protein kinase
VLQVEKEGQKVKQGTEITVKISKGNLIEVPNVVGKPEEVARALLQNDGFTNIATEPSDQEGEPGKVVAQTPNAKQKRSKNTKITLTVITEQTPTPDDSGTPTPDDTDPGGEGGTDDNGTTGGLLNP